MSTTNRKVRKMRGGGGNGYGCKKKHRGKGSKGGKGYSGSHKHHYIRTMIEEPDHFGKHGFTSLKKLKKENRVINVGEILKLTDKKEIDLGEMGFDKLLGKGSVNVALTITVPFVSKQAKEKIEKAGGQVIAEEASESEEEFEEIKPETSESEEELEEAEEEAEAEEGEGLEE